MIDSLRHFTSPDSLHALLTEKGVLTTRGVPFTSRSITRALTGHAPRNMAIIDTALAADLQALLFDNAVTLSMLVGAAGDPEVALA